MKGSSKVNLLPLLYYSLTSKAIVDSLSSGMNIWFLDDGIFAGTAESLSADFVLMK